ncbi:hypothetical protein OH76DRAFT_1482742 [Lentinus brumalis]|uniref:EF-hand domain-containing protein n=1 Tax=Lentinus brumalis TaxID=2498619 RepID=A0A371DBN3_9APHY|nr:hypothetical protein OH76DRAFT_1482742 [Polyporus brumalis]
MSESPTPFLGAGPQAQSLPNSKFDRMDSLQADAECGLKRIAEQLLCIPAKRTLGEVQKVADKVVHIADHILKLVEHFADIHPIAKIVHGALAAFVEVYKLHSETDIRIHIVLKHMLDAVTCIKILREIEGPEDELASNVEVTFQQMASTIKDFGAYVDLYHGYWQPVYKLLLAHHHHAKLKHLHETFEEHRAALERMLNARIAKRTNMQLKSLSTNITDIKASADQILAHVTKLERAEHPEATDFIEDRGADKIVKDDVLLAKLGLLLREKVTETMKETLRRDFDDLLEIHGRHFDMKVEQVEKTLLMSKGHHELIHRREVQKIWEENRWRSSVQCSVFVEALHVFYETRFREHLQEHNMPHEDAWTVDIFARATYHSAIGDMVDEDGSDLISASEMNKFSAVCPEGWSTAQWFAFCACGWANNNAWYYRRIEEFMVDKEIGDGIRSHTADRGSQPNDWQTIHDVMESLGYLLYVEDVDDLSEAKVPPELRVLQERYREQEVTAIADRLEKLDYHLKNDSDVAAVAGSRRPELHIMCLFYVLARRIHGAIKSFLHSNSSRRERLSDLRKIEDAAQSCLVAFFAFQARMQELMRGWRSQGRNIDLQIDRYADGLFRNVRHEAPRCRKAAETLCGALFHGTPSRYRKLIDAMTRSSQAQQLNDLVVQVATLSKTVEKLKQLLSAQHEHVSKLTASLDYHDRHHAEQEATTITVKRVDTSESSTKNAHTRKRDYVLRPFTRARADSESTLAETEEKELEKVTFWPRGLSRVHWH